jgi:hypothetical protein
MAILTPEEKEELIRIIQEEEEELIEEMLEQERLREAREEAGLIPTREELIEEMINPTKNAQKMASPAPPRKMTELSAIYEKRYLAARKARAA